MAAVDKFLPEARFLRCFRKAYFDWIRVKSFHFESATLPFAQRAVKNDGVRCASNCVTVKPCGVHGAKSINVTNARYSSDDQRYRRRSRSYVANTYGTPFVLWGCLSARCQTINAFSMYTQWRVCACFFLSPE